MGRTRDLEDALRAVVIRDVGRVRGVVDDDAAIGASKIHQLLHLHSEGYASPIKIVCHVEQTLDSSLSHKHLDEHTFLQGWRTCCLVAAAPVGLLGEQKKIRSVRRICIGNLPTISISRHVRG